VLTVPGDRRDQDLEAIVGHVAGRFDHFICRQDEDLRGRKDGEIPAKLEKALRGHGIAADRITLIKHETDAIDAALDMAEADDLVLVFAENITRSWKQIIYFGRDGEAPAAPKQDAAPGHPLPADDTIIRDERGVRLRDIGGVRRL
jgi:cyanophycin synthetase